MARGPDRPPTTEGHRAHPLTYSEFARRCGRGRSRVSEALKGALAAAVLPGGLIDAAHPAAVAWAAERGVDAKVLLGGLPPTPAPAEPASAPASPPEDQRPPAPLPSISVRLDVQGGVDPTDERLLDMSMREIVERFGSMTGFDGHVDVVKTIHEIERIELANQKTRGELVPRVEVEKAFSALDGAFRRMLTDVPKVIARRVKQDVAAGASTEDVEKAVRAQLGTALDGVKALALKQLEETPPDDDDGELPAQ